MEANAVIANELLDGKSNYEKWSIQVKTYLWDRDLWDTVDPDVDGHEDGETDRKNEVALHAILISCGIKPFQVIKSITSAREAWAALQAEYGQKPSGEAGESDSGRADLLDWSTSHKSLQRKKSKISKPRVKVLAPPIESESESESELEVVAGKEPVESESQAESNNVAKLNYPEMFQSVKRGDWITTRGFLDEDPEAIQATIPYSGKNVLHVAVSEGHLYIVKRLLDRMTNEQIELRRFDGFTPLNAAIEIGSLPIAHCLIQRHMILAYIANADGLPVHHAITSYHKKMVSYLYSVTPIEYLKSIENGKSCAALLAQCIDAKHYDVALNLLIRVPELVIEPHYHGKSPLWALASSELFSDKESTWKFWRRWIYKCIHVSVEIENPEDYQSDNEDSNLDKAIDFFCVPGRMCFGMLRRVVKVPLRLLDIKSLYQMKLVREQTREILRCVCQVIEGTSQGMSLRKAGLRDAMIQAVIHGNVDFIIGIAKANPELVWSPYISREVIKVAIQYRQPKIFSLVYGLRDKMAMASHLDENESNMLHKAAIIATPIVLNRIPGAALQMQRELQWFKEVETLVSPAAIIATTAAHPGSTKKNKVYLTPHEIFTESHKNLVIAGEKWMKDTSSSCTVVGALIITVTFAAAFTFPGGNEQTKGYPMFIGKSLFRVFMISNAVALSASTSSVLMFLGILTSRYAEEDFLISLPKKLIFGLSTLFFSIAAMLTAFCAGLSLMFHQALWIVIPSALLACIPLVSFAAIQFPLLVDIVMSTYGPYFNKNNKRWI